LQGAPRTFGPAWPRLASTAWARRLSFVLVWPCLQLLY
jgi:hypothetical protein